MTKEAQQGTEAEREIQSLTYNQVFQRAELLGKAILGRKL